MKQAIRLWLLAQVGRVPIEVERIPSDTGGPEWFARIPGTDLRGDGYSYEAAIGALIESHRHAALGARLNLLEIAGPACRE